MATDVGLTDSDTRPDRLDWLDELHGHHAAAWVKMRNMSTEELLKDEEYHKDFHNLCTTLGHADKAPEVTKIDEFVYNFWKDAQHPQGIWRRMLYTEFKTKFEREKNAGMCSWTSTRSPRRMKRSTSGMRSTYFQQIVVGRSYTCPTAGCQMQI